MSTQTCYQPRCSRKEGAVELVIEPRTRDLGGFSVRRVLPSADRSMVGPFIFFDHMGPAAFPAGKGIDVRPHPHIGLATVTYLFEGEIVHRDSLGFVQPIRPGAVNLMTAGRGIVHSERSGSERAVESTLHGIQSWMALPLDREEAAPSFVHHPADSLPEAMIGEATVRVIAGSAFDLTSPVVCYSPTLYLDVRLPKGAALRLPDAHAERAVYIVSGGLLIDAHSYGEGVMAVVGADRVVDVTAERDSHVMVIAGQPLGERHIWWNFVSSSRERIERAKRDWTNGAFSTVAGDDEFIPLPAD
jgi:redox-sensitive bicupin YhaK (pirin superfamily)